jgi:hypothetical protein
MGKKTVQLGVRCDPDWKAAVERIARRENRKASDLVRLIVDAWIAGQRPEKGLDATDRDDLEWMRTMRSAAPRILAAAIRLADEARRRESVRDALLAVEGLALEELSTDASRSSRLGRTTHRARRAERGTK